MADDPNNGYMQGGFSSRRWSVGQTSPSEQERMAALAFSQEIINNAHTQADRVLKAAERQAEAIVEKARREADEIIQKAREHAAELPDRTPATAPVPDEERLRAYAARCVEACMADLRQRQQETLDYMNEQWRQLLGGLTDREVGPEPARSPQESVRFSDAPLFPDAEPDVGLDQIEAKVSAIAQQLAAFAEEE